MTETPEGGPKRNRGFWRIGTPLVVLLSGALFAVSADNSEGTDLRPGRYTDLASLVDAEADDYDELEDRVADLKQEVDGLTDAGGRRRRPPPPGARSTGSRDPAGLRAARGRRASRSPSPTLPRS